MFGNFLGLVHPKVFQALCFGDFQFLILKVLILDISKGFMHFHAWFLGCCGTSRLLRAEAQAIHRD